MKGWLRQTELPPACYQKGMTKHNKNETDSTEQAVALEHEGSVAHCANTVSEWLLPHAWIGLVVIAGLLIVLGVLNNDLAAVFSKAATICLECIGIG